MIHPRRAKTGTSSALLKPAGTRRNSRHLLDPSETLRALHRGDYGDSLAAPLNHSDRSLACVAKKVRGRGERRSGIGGAAPVRGGRRRGAVEEGRRERARRQPSVRDGDRAGERWSFTLLNGFSTEPPRVRTRRGSITW